MMEPYTGEFSHDINMCWGFCCFTAGQLAFKVSTETAPLFYADPTRSSRPPEISMRVTTDNQANKDVVRLTAKVCQINQCFTKDYQKGRRNVEYFSFWEEVVEDVIKPGESRVDQFLIQLSNMMFLNKYSLDSHLIKVSFYVQVYGDVDGQCRIDFRDIGGFLPLHMIPSWLQPGVEGGSGIGGNISSTPTIDLASETKEDEYGVVVSQSSVPPTSTYGVSQVLPSSSQPASQTQKLIDDVRAAGLGMSQKEVIETAVRDGSISSITCSEVVQVLQEIYVDMYRKDAIVTIHPIISDKENFETVVLGEGISSLYHDEIKRAL